MRKTIAALSLPLALPLCGAAFAGVITVSGHGQSHDYATAVADARADAISACTDQGGTPGEEVYSHVTRANEWLADVILRCEVP